jgi:hypothetical protein
LKADPSATPQTGLPAPKKGTRRTTLMWVLVISLGLHLVGGVIATIIVVAKYFSEPPAAFVSKPMKVPLVVQEREQRMAQAEFEAAAAAPSFDNKILSQRLMEKGLPPLPALPTDTMLPLQPSALLSNAPLALAGTGLIGAGEGAGAGGLGGGGASFFGLETSAKRIVIIFDISKSVLTKADRAGVPITQIREETERLISNLSINCSFNLVQFSRNYLAFRDELVPPTDAQRKAALDWLATEFRTNGSLTGKGVQRRYPNGIEFVLEEVFKMRPETIYLLSDGDFQCSPSAGLSEQVPIPRIEKLIDSLQKGQTTPVQIQMIGFQMKPDQKKELQRLLRATKGNLREVAK